MKLWTLFFFLPTILAFSSRIPLNELGTRIVNGQDATPGQYPYQAGLFVTLINNRFTFCGGSLISSRWVLTAGHCAYQATSYDVVLGATRIRDDTEDGRVVLTTRDYVLHTDYSPAPELRNDIAIVRLVDLVDFSDLIKPVALSDSDDDVGEVEIVSGWGLTSDSSTDISPSLRFTTLRIISDNDCLREFNVGPEVICANTINLSVPTSTCEGDSGGPLVNNKTDDFVLKGVISFGSNFGCELGHPQGFTRVSYYRQWIRSAADV